MRYLKEQGYRVISLSEFHEFLSLRRQLPRRSVVITFDDGYKSFMQYAYPLLKQLGFTATLFVYTDYVGAGRNALNWDDLTKLDADGFQVEGHSKTHSDLRRRRGIRGRSPPPPARRDGGAAEALRAAAGPAGALPRLSLRRGGRRVLGKATSTATWRPSPCAEGNASFTARSPDPPARSTRR